MTAPAHATSGAQTVRTGPAWLDRFVAPTPGTPVYLETSDPSAVRRVVELTAHGPQTSAATPVVVVSPDAGMAGWLGEQPERVVVIGGNDAGAGLGAWLDARADLLLAGVCVVEPGLARRVVGRGRVGVEAIVSAGLEAQSARLNAMHAANVARYGPRTRAWWADRFARALGGGGPGLRVLIITTRYSTFVRHSSEDLAEALGEQGCDVRVLIEPDGHSTLTTAAYARAIHDHEPDLAICINYARAHLGPALKLPLPFVCWVQDELRHLFDPAAGRAAGVLDFLVGHTHDAFFSRCGFDPSRAMCAPVPVSGRKFHPGSITRAQRERFACDIAYVGHQSEPPPALRDRLIASARGAGPGNAIPAIIDAVYPEVERLAAEPLGEPVMPRLSAALGRAVHGVTGREPDALVLTQLMGSVVKPLADRVIRHQMLGWAAQIADRRGWRMRVYGRGWREHPDLGRFAAGEVEHGDDLRACYQAARVHLHASISTNLHQRVVECALSGGLPLVRIKREDLDIHDGYLRLLALDKGYACLQSVTDRCGHSWVIDYPDAAMLQAMRQRLGLMSQFGFSYLVQEPSSPCERRDSLLLDRDLVWLMGDLAETGFGSYESLERVLEAQTDEVRRAQCAEGIAKRGRVVEADEVMKRTLKFIARTLAEALPNGRATA